MQLLVLISTYWNVNITVPILSITELIVLISTYWNVNDNIRFALFETYEF